MPGRTGRVAVGELRPPRSLPPPLSFRISPHACAAAPAPRVAAKLDADELTSTRGRELVAEEKGGGENFWQPAGVTLNRTGAFET